MDYWKDHPLFKSAVSFAQVSWTEVERITRELPALAVRVAQVVPFSEDAVAAFYAALDPKTPSAKRLMIWGPLLYFVIPTDAIPDFIPGLGFVDDAAAIATMIAAVGSIITADHRADARKLLGLPAIAPDGEA